MIARALAALIALAAVAAPAAAAPRRGAVVRVPVADPAAGVRLGRAAAPVELTYFYAPGARHAATGLDRAVALQARHPARLALRIRVRPLPGVMRWCEALLEAGRQGRLLPFEAATRGLTNPDDAALLAAAASAGLDVPALRAAWRDGRHAAALASNEGWWYRLAGRSGRDAAFAPDGPTLGLARTSDDDLEATYQAHYRRVIGAEAAAAPAPRPAGLRDRRRVDQAIPRATADDPLTATPSRLPDGRLQASLDLRGWPTVGPAGAAQLITLVCNLRRGACGELLAMVAQLRPAFGDDLRVGWAPWIDPDADDAAMTGLFHDAVPCADAQGAGWAWLDAADASAAVERDADGTAAPWRRLDALIDSLALRRADFYRCLAVHAGQSLRFARRAVAAGLDASPALIIGDRLIFGGPVDAHGLAELLAAEAAPGVLARLSAPPRAADAAAPR